MIYILVNESLLPLLRNVFITTLAISDLVLCLFTMPSTLWEVRQLGMQQEEERSLEDENMQSRQKIML
jgi:hypothetical protein